MNLKFGKKWLYVLAPIVAIGASALGMAATADASSSPTVYNGELIVCWNTNSDHTPTVWRAPYTCPTNWQAEVLGTGETTGGATGPQGPAGPAGPTGPKGATGATGAQGEPGGTSLFTEVDNGTEFTVSTALNLADTSSSGATYADAGVVQDLGTLSSVTTGSLAYTGGAGLAENLWIGDGPEASTAGTHLLSAGADFCYGLGQSDGSFYMTDAACGSYDGQTLTLAQIKSDFPGVLEAYAWVGVVSSGAAVSPTAIKTVDGQQIGEIATILDSSGVLTPMVSTS